VQDELLGDRRCRPFPEMSRSLSNTSSDAMDRTNVQHDEPLLLLLAAASFVEAASEVYSRNLLQHFRGDVEVSDWLVHHWEPEELRHGKVLRAYIASVWPEFDWRRAYERFHREYVTRCTVEELEPTRGLEMVARCVVETGTASLYRAIRDFSRDPALKSIAGMIHRDEVRHYKHFFRYFRKYQLAERNSRRQILNVLARRTLEMRLENAECGIRHTVKERYQECSSDPRVFREMQARVTALVRTTYPFGMGCKMLLKPLALPTPLAAIAGTAISLVARGYLLRHEHWRFASRWSKSRRI